MVTFYAVSTAPEGQRTLGATMLVALALIQLTASQAPAGLAFAPPDEWKRTVDQRSRVVMYAPRGLSFGQVCVFTVFQPEAFAGNAVVFHDEILRRATSGNRQLEPSQSGMVGGFNTTALHQQMPNGLQMWFRIYTARWGDRGQTFILSANAPDVMRQYARVADSMMALVEIPGAPAAAPPPMPAPPPPPGAGGASPFMSTGTASFGDYVYSVPDGWTQMPSGNNLWVVSPPSETGERCTISLWPMAPARAGDLLSDAAQAWPAIFREFAVPPGAATQLIRGTAPQGWEYAVFHRDMAAAGSPDATLTGFVMLVRLGNRVATISWLSKAQLYSSCVHFYTGLPKVWPRFFASLGFRGWTAPSGTSLGQAIAGSWESFGSSTGGGAVLQYAFTPAGRYAFTGVGQRYMALSRFEAAVWTSTTFGDGSYSLRGNELTLKPDRGQPETYIIRLEHESKDGRTWTEKLYMMKPERVTYLDGSRIEDNEVGFTRLNP